MVEEKKGMNTKVLIGVVFGFFALGMIAILNSRDADHQSYSDNASNAQETLMLEGAKSLDNVFVE